MRTASPGVHVAMRSVLVRRLLVFVALLAALTVSVGAARTAWAHSGLAAASPGPGAIVGGDIDVVQLFYGDLILEFDATLIAPSGEVLTVEPVMLSEINAELRLAEPLSEPGEYEVRHTVLSFDDDIVEADYRFTFDPDAAPPILIFIEEDDGGLAWWAWTILGISVLAVIVLALRLGLSIRRARALAAARADERESV